MKPGENRFVEKSGSSINETERKRPMKKISVLLLACLVLSAPTQKANQKTQKSQAKPQREIAITFDDLPATSGDMESMTGLTKRLLQSIKSNKVPAIGFVNESKLYNAGAVNDKAVALLKMWLDAGLELGNHTYSHISIDQSSLERYKADVIRGEINTRKLLEAKGMKLRFFRHTQLRTGPTAEYKKGLAEFLTERGYTVAPVTIDNNDYIFAALYADAKLRRDQAIMKRLTDAYIPYMESVFAHFEKLSVDFLGYEVKQTLLLHANELNADYFDELAQMMRRRGYSFISLADALKDKAYDLPDAQANKGLSWIHRWMLAKGLQMKPEPLEPEFVTQLFQARQR
jgi:peptidoglycan/xylan/chitin deacetylase (PgdA/CDA1 family)